MKYIFLPLLICTSISQAFALDNQILSGKKYLENLPQLQSKENEPEYVEIKRDLMVGKTYNEIKLLQKQWGYTEDGIYSKELQEFIKKAQAQKGLNPTGIIDFNTWFILYNQPQSWRQEEVNKALENWEKIKEKDFERNNKFMLVVNIPSTTLTLYAKDENKTYKKVLTSKVVIGSSRHRTPLKDLNIVSLKYNPTWTPTNNIVARTIFNKSGEVNYKWLESHDITVYNKSNEIIPYEDIINYNFKELRFVQPSGDGNSLGLLKFETDSKENIYLHDTNQKNLFGYNVRTYSSGCIRVEDYSNLAATILGKNKEHISNQISKTKTFWEKVPQSVPVYFDTSRISFDDEGFPHFYSKVY